EPETGRGRARLRDDGRDDLRAVDGQQVPSARAVEVDVAHPVRRAQDGPGRGRPGEADAGREIVAVRLDQGPVLERAVAGLDHRARGRIEVRELVVPLDVWRRVFVAQAEVEGELRRRLPV